MEFFQNKTTQLIALVSIIGTLAGFGYTGATYVNRLENLEAKIGGISEAEDMAQDIENNIRIDAYDHVQYLDQAWYENQHLGNITAILNDD